MRDARRLWLWPALLVGLAYALVGILFALPRSHAQFWRLAAWGVSGVAYGAHILYERLRLRHSTMFVAMHVATAAALGGFGIAVGANVHSLAVESTEPHKQLLRLSLLLWPIVTAVPAFLVALVASPILAWIAARLWSGRRSPGPVSARPPRG